MTRPGDYVPTTYVNGVTAITAARLNNPESQLDVVTDFVIGLANEVTFGQGGALSVGELDEMWRVPTRYTSGITIVYQEITLYEPSSNGAVTLDLLTAASATPATHATLYVTNSASKPSIAAGAYNPSGTVTLPSTVALSAGDFLIPSITAVGTNGLAPGRGLTWQVGYVVN